MPSFKNLSTRKHYLLRKCCRLSVRCGGRRGLLTIAIWPQRDSQPCTGLVRPVGGRKAKVLDTMLLGAPVGRWAFS
jgi:hypothetical protein